MTNLANFNELVSDSSNSLLGRDLIEDFDRTILGQSQQFGSDALFGQEEFDSDLDDLSLDGLEDLFS